MTLKKLLIVLICALGLVFNASAQNVKDVYKYTVLETSEIIECRMSDLKFSSYSFDFGTMFHLCKSKEGPAYILTFFLSSLNEGNPIIHWANNSSVKRQKINITVKLSNGKTITPAAWIQNNTREDLRGSTKVGSVLLVLGGTYASLVKNLTMYDVESITYMGKTISFGNVKTASTISAMVNDIKTR